MSNSKSFSNEITLVRVNDGDSANMDSYFIQSNYDDIVAFDEGETIVFSPDKLNFKVYKSSDLNNPLSLDNWGISILDVNGDSFIPIDSSKDKKYPTFIGKDSNIAPEVEVIDDVEDDIRQDVLYVWLGGLYDFLKTKSGSWSSDEEGIYNSLSSLHFTLKFSYIEENEEAAYKILSCRLGVSEDLAKLHISASGIAASIRDASLRFNANGLKLKNGDFTIYGDKYEKVEGLTQSGFKPGIYYYITTNDEYVLAEEFEEGTDYYELGEEQLLSAIDGTLTLKGDVYANNGFFRGRIEATEGSFKGKIEAAEGEIGGFNIFNNDKGIYLESANQAIVLDGTNGRIIAENIELGGGAVITDKVELSEEKYKQISLTEEEFEINKYYVLNDTEYVLANSFDQSRPYYKRYPYCALYNPILHNGQVLSAANISLTNEGKLNLGTLELYGGTGRLDGHMRSTHVDENGQKTTGNWIIRENGTAEFNNVIANYAKIQEAVFEKGTVQAVGGLMVFKDSWRVLEVNSSDYSVILEADENITVNLKANDWIASNNNFYKVKSVIKNKIFVKGDIDLLTPGCALIKFGQAGQEGYVEAKETDKIIGRVYYEWDEGTGQYVLTQDQELQASKTYYYLGITEQSKDCIISILGENETSVVSSRPYASGNALTISTFGDPSKGMANTLYTKHLILGDLSQANIDDVASLSGFGLYCDNVYLNGSLVTKVDEGSYAGVSTSASGVQSNKIANDTSQIVFWAGASDMGEGIKNATFQVTQDGSVYAENSIISNSIIQGSDIYASRVHGGQPNNPAPLSIYDTGNESELGIGFYKNFDKDTEEGELVFQIRSFGFQQNDGTYFIKLPQLNGGSVSFCGDLITKNNKVSISDNGISFPEQGMTIQSLSDISNSNISQLNFMYKQGADSKKIMMLEPSKARIFEELHLDFDLFLGENSHLQVAKKNGVEVGYDLYIQ